MKELNDGALKRALDATTPPLPPALDRRTAALTRAHRVTPETRPVPARPVRPAPRWARLSFAPSLVPALLISAAVVFALDAMAWLSRFRGA